ncbi:S24/S26 family peptidase [Candidatus Woesearchaeota archaeon]|nr:S24/S26 family peptidase [Candidatus Woesearchaeota archaeon]
MMYDKNQFYFNVLLSVLSITLIIFSVIYGHSLIRINASIADINNNLVEIEKNQNYINYIQGSHDDLNYQLIPTGFFIADANDFGTIAGASMQPSVFQGNTLIQVKYTDQVLQQGQIIRYIDEDRVPVIHRIRAIYNSTIHVQGDNLEEGEIIDKSQVTHIVIGVLFT